MDITDRINRKLAKKPYPKILAALYIFEGGMLFGVISKGESLIFTIPLFVVCITIGIIGMDFRKT